MSLEHSLIPDSDLHPMKGAATATSGQLPVADGAGDTAFTTPFNTYGQMTITNGTTATVIAAAADATFATNSDYVQVVASLVSGTLSNVGFTTDHLIAQKAGTYRYRIRATVNAAAASRTAIKLRVNLANQTLKGVVATPITEDTLIDVDGFVTLAVNDEISFFIANTVGNVTVKEANVSLERFGIL